MPAIGNAIGIPFGIKQDWISYWKSQSEVLFFGLYSEISGGQMPNKVTGATDFLTVAGVVGSETYQTPNTAAYIAADTDKIWFYSDGTQRTTTTAELIGYDLQRTPVKYNDTTPNAIVAIMILKAGETIAGTKRDKLFTDMWLPIMWDNSLSAYGHVKDNRGATQQLWTVESPPNLLLHLDNNVTDSSHIPQTVSNVGPVTFATTTGKFSYYGVFSATKYLTIPDWDGLNLGSGDFTLDFWIRPTTLVDGSWYFLCGQGDAVPTAATRQLCVAIVGTASAMALDFFVFDTTSTQLTSTTGTTKLLINNWYHIAIVRYGNTAKGYLNGVAECTLDLTGVTLQNGTGTFAIGRMGLYNSNQFIGWIDEFRLTKGKARWTSSPFTPPIAAGSPNN